MAKFGGVEVSKAGGTWAWRAAGVLWQFRTVPRLALFRQGFDVLPRKASQQPLIVMDAVMFSLGWELSRDLGRGHDGPLIPDGGDAA